MKKPANKKTDLPIEEIEKGITISMPNQEVNYVLKPSPKSRKKKAIEQLEELKKEFPGAIIKSPEKRFNDIFYSYKEPAPSGMRMKRNAIDHLKDCGITSYSLLEDEVHFIKKKTSKLSATQRNEVLFIYMLVNNPA